MSRCLRVLLLCFILPCALSREALRVPSLCAQPTMTLFFPSIAFAL